MEWAFEYQKMQNLNELPINKAVFLESRAVRSKNTNIKWVIA